MKILALFCFILSPAWGETITPCFTPQENCTGSITHILENAQLEILVQAYSFTSHDIATALLEAQKRGVIVRVLLDRSQQKDERSSYNKLTKAGMDIRIDHVSGIAHNKIMIIDERMVITGSFNFTHAAQHRNTENVLFIDSREIALKYKENWLKRARKAQSYAAAKQAAQKRSLTSSRAQNVIPVTAKKIKKPIPKHIKIMRKIAASLER